MAFGVKKDPWLDPYADLRSEAAMNQSPVPTTGSPTADLMQRGGADLSQYSGAPTMPANDQFSPAPQQTTADFMSEKADGFDVKGLLSNFGKAFGGDEGGAAAQKMPAPPKLQISPLQYGAGAKPVVQALPDLNTQQQQRSAAAQAIANAASMYAGQPQQQPVQQQQQQPTLINRMLFG